MTVLCIDPSLKQSGISVFKDNKLVKTTIASGISGNFNVLRELIKTYKPDLIIKEDCYCGPNRKTYYRLAQIHGVIDLLGELYNIPIKSYTPSEGKKTAGTNTKDKQSKEKVRDYVNLYFGTNIINMDVTDSMILYINYVKEME